MIFEWDADKAEANLNKHGIRFEMAAKVFLDAASVTVIDDRFDYGEERRVTYGRIYDRLCVVVWVEDLERGVIRIISARKANARERKRHDNG